MKGVSIMRGGNSEGCYISQNKEKSYYQHRSENACSTSYNILVSSNT